MLERSVVNGMSRESHRGTSADRHDVKIELLIVIGIRPGNPAATTAGKERQLVDSGDRQDYGRREASRSGQVENIRSVRRMISISGNPIGGIGPTALNV